MTSKTPSLWLLLMSCSTALFGPAHALAQVVPADGQTLAREMMKTPVETANPEGKAAISVADTPEADGRANAEDARIQVGAVRISGASTMPQSAFAEIADKYVGRSVDKAGLQELARAIATEARSKGFIFASAAIPAQSVDMGIIPPSR
jgi:hemolysin activation/secretion protein